MFLFFTVHILTFISFPLNNVRIRAKIFNQLKVSGLLEEVYLYPNVCCPKLYLLVLSLLDIQTIRMALLLSIYQTDNEYQDG